MGKAGRIACIFTPYVLTIASLVCLILVGLGNTNKNSSTLNSLYFLKIDLSNFTSTANSADLNSAEIINIASQVNSKLNSTETLLYELEVAFRSSHVEDFYTIGLWNYCSGGKTNGTTFCSTPHAAYWFNPIDVWHLNNTQGLTLPSDLQSALNTYKAVSKWMFIAYLVAFIATATELVVGIFAICSRWGSCVTSIVAAIAGGFTVAASVTSTALFATLTGTLDSLLKKYGVSGSLGTSMLSTTWLAALFSLAAALFWLFSMCCCSGRSPHGDRRRVTAEKAPYTYERIGSPYGGSPHVGAPANVATHTANVPMQSMKPQAYEPFRHV